MEREYPPESTIDDIKIAIRRSYRNPQIGHTFQSVIKNGPRTYKIATVFEIKNTKTNELHHYALRLDTINKQKSGWRNRPEHSIYIDGDNGEIEKLIRFVIGSTNCEIPEQDGIFHLLEDEKYLSAEAIATLVQRSDFSEKAQLMRAIIEDISDSDSIPMDLQESFQSGSIRVLESISTSARIVQYRRALAKLQEMVDSHCSNETEIQKLLEENPWLFGSEYSELIERRSWTRDDKLDFMLRRTVDGYLEIIEIKTPFSNALFNYDESHDNYYPAAVLSKTIGQVMRYIEEIDRNRDSISARDGYDPLKIRARIIIGRDGKIDHQKSLHNLNAHLVQIEIITFDQLVKIGDRVLNVFNDTLNSFEVDDEIPEEDYPFDNFDEEEIPF